MIRKIASWNFSPVIISTYITYTSIKVIPTGFPKIQNYTIIYMTKGPSKKCSKKFGLSECYNILNDLACLAVLLDFMASIVIAFSLKKSFYTEIEPVCFH